MEEIHEILESDEVGCGKAVPIGEAEYSSLHQRKQEKQRKEEERWKCHIPVPRACVDVH
jgi:hypothetical protein